MRLEGIHHVTAITGDAPGNVDSTPACSASASSRRPSTRMTRPSTTSSMPTSGAPGADITFFEYPGARRGRAGAGMVHRVIFRVGSEEALDFWEERLRGAGVDVSRTPGSLAFSDPEGLGLELTVVETKRRAADGGASGDPDGASDPGLRHRPAPTHATPMRAASSSKALSSFSRADGAFEARGDQRGGLYVYDRTDERGIPGAVRSTTWPGRRPRTSTRHGGSV